MSVSTRRYTTPALNWSDVSGLNRWIPLWKRGPLPLWTTSHITKFVFGQLTLPLVYLILRPRLDSNQRSVVSVYCCLNLKMASVLLAAHSGAYSNKDRVTRNAGKLADVSSPSSSLLGYRWNGPRLYFGLSKMAGRTEFESVVSWLTIKRIKPLC